MKQTTLTVGIPAYNEAQNIALTIQSVLRQKCLSFRLDRILVICDGSSDNTPDIVALLQRNFPIITLRNDGKRLGKAARLNECYEANDSDFIFTLDADVILDTNRELETVLERARKTHTKVVSAHQLPMPQHGFIRRILYANHCLWTQVRLPINGGNYIQNLQGSATLITREFAKQIHYPVGIPSDQGYLYIKSSQKNAFAFSPDNRIIYQPLGTISDWNRLNKRIRSEHHSLRKYFGEKIPQLYSPPRRYILRALVAQLKIDPLFTILALGMNYFFKFVTPFQKPDVTGLWTTLTSTKKAIVKEALPTV